MEKLDGGKHFTLRAGYVKGFDGRTLASVKSLECKIYRKHARATVPFHEDGGIWLTNPDGDHLLLMAAPKEAVVS